MIVPAGSPAVSPLKSWRDLSLSQPDLASANAGLFWQKNARWQDHEWCRRLPPWVVSSTYWSAAVKIPLSDRPRKFCSKCNEITPWNTHDRCLQCQRRRSKAYAERKTASGGGFSPGVKERLKAANPLRCPKCNRLWSEVKKHGQHPDTPWHFDHHVSPQHGGTNDDSKARIMGWPCNLEKLNKNA